MNESHAAAAVLAHGYTIFNQNITHETGWLQLSWLAARHGRHEYVLWNLPDCYKVVVFFAHLLGRGKQVGLYF